jgi:hypothetical protein
MFIDKLLLRAVCMTIQILIIVVLGFPLLWLNTGVSVGSYP